MADSQDSISQEIPQGFCQCGCDQRTKLILRSDKRYGHIAGQPHKFIRGHHQIGHRNSAWNGGKKIQNGYALIKMPHHHRANASGYVSEHILVMEEVLKRKIFRPETIHHIDGDRLNNIPGNLMVFKTSPMHTGYHERLNAFKSCGHYNWYQCPYCHQWDKPSNLVYDSPFNKGKKNTMIHRTCRINWLREYRKRNH